MPPAFVSPVRALPLKSLPLVRLRLAKFCRSRLRFFTDRLVSCRKLCSGGRPLRGRASRPRERVRGGLLPVRLPRVAGEAVWDPVLACEWLRIQKDVTLLSRNRRRETLCLYRGALRRALERVLHARASRADCALVVRAEARHLLLPIAHVRTRGSAAVSLTN